MNFVFRDFLGGVFASEDLSDTAIQLVLCVFVVC